jgi:AraC-like DNA-binding protein
MSLYVSDDGRSLEAALTRGAPARLARPENPIETRRSLRMDAIDRARVADAAEMFGASCWTFGDVALIRTFCANAPASQWPLRVKSLLEHWRVVLVQSRCGRRDSLTLWHGRKDGGAPRPPAVPFDERARDMEVLTLFLPRDFYDDEVKDSGSAAGLAISPELGSLLAGYIDNLARQLPHISPEQAHGLAAATCSLVAACIVPGAERREAADVSLVSLLVDRARMVVRENMACPGFGPEQLARLLAMSRSKLYRLFERTGGVAHFINRERLREAHHRLDAPGDAPSIHVIGNEVGFSDHSTFSRAFRREFGYSPTDARERSLARFPSRHEPLAHCGAGTRSRKFGMTSAELGF